ncbi:MAG: cell division protein SepF [Promethearchaeota archaeon]
MKKFWRKIEENLLTSPQETMGFSKEKDYLQKKNIRNFLIKKYNFYSINQVGDIKKQLLANKILIINAEELFEKDIPIVELKKAIDEIKTYLNECGGSIGRIGHKYLILTPNSNIRIAN